jgi:hypothetical protein
LRREPLPADAGDTENLDGRPPLGLAVALAGAGRIERQNVLPAMRKLNRASLTRRPDGTDVTDAANMWSSLSSAAARLFAMMPPNGSMFSFRSLAAL